jgi:hypothetical protein
MPLILYLLLNSLILGTPPGLPLLRILLLLEHLLEVLVHSGICDLLLRLRLIDSKRVLSTAAARVRFFIGAGFVLFDETLQVGDVGLVVVVQQAGVVVQHPVLGGFRLRDRVGVRGGHILVLLLV